MPTLRRMLKFTPVVLMGVLVLLWIFSLRGFVAHDFQWSRYAVLLSAYNGNVACSVVAGEYLAQPRRSEEGQVKGDPVPPPELGIVSFFGHFSLLAHEMSWASTYSVQIPLLLLVTLLLPVVTGSLTGFRFRLWHYLAYTALVALELAYYLRWQE